MEELFLTNEQGEIANISMGNSATTLSMMVNRKVDITTPNVKIIKRSEALDDYEKTCIFVQIHYVKGLEGNNVLVLKEHDVKVMTDLMMGGDGTNTAGEITELHLSAASEAMNQMMGSAATAMGIMLDRLVDISTPETIQMNAGDYIQLEFPNDDKFVEIAFDVKLGKEIKCNVVQMYPYTLAKAIADLFIIRKKNEEANA